MKKRIPFGVWEPDSGAVTGLGRVTKAVNVVPVKGGYKALDGWGPAYENSTGSNQFLTTSISPAGVVNALSTVSETGGVYFDFISTTGAVYAIPYTGQTASVITGSLTVANPVVFGPTFERNLYYRDMVQYGAVVIATSGRTLLASDTAPICVSTLSPTPTSFTDIGAGFQADFVTVLRDFVVYGSTRDPTDGLKSGRVRWSGFGDYTANTPSASTQADLQDLIVTYGPIRRLLGGNEVFVICERGVVLMQYVGGATIMRFDYIHNDMGTQHPLSCVRVGNYVYMYSQGGFVRVGMASGDVVTIGKGRVDEEFFYLLTNGNTSTPAVRAYHDEVNRCIGWQYSPTNGDAFVYFYDSDMWAVHGTDRTDAYFVYSSSIASGASGTLPTYYQKKKTATAIATNGVLYTQLNNTQKAKYQIATGFEEMTPGRKAIIDKVWPVYDIRGAAPTNPELVVTSIPKLAGVNLYSEPTSTYSSTAAVQSEGFFTVTGPGSYEGRYHRFQLENSDTASERTGEQAILGLDVEYFERGNY